MKAQDERDVVRLKKPLLACSLVLGVAMGLQATPVLPCSDYTNYAELNPNSPNSVSCTIGDMTFGGFTYGESAVIAIPVPASAVTFTTIDNGPSAIGFQFNAVPLTAEAGWVNEITLGFTVIGPNIDDAAIGPTPMVGSAVGTGAAATISESICPSTANCLSMSTFNIVDGPSRLTDNVTFTSVSTVSISKSVTVVGGSGFATINQFSDTVSQSVVPEPGFYGVLAGGVGAILMFAQRRKKTHKA